ncbi:hypothetical protein [Plantactinospora soyae]|uniref:Uncharacterized protein n=1 Tax=Plantactinospora soyae TaxID=1544732 RepID=A0A927MBU3_9ACTN|nr:hypothetical protein [Plantactinospora soyae]MBE1491604.1 hypothetical protein [Plantactinospora soyae]
MAGSLARRYRRLLFCYPRAHRRAELLATLLEAAPPGRTRPTAREAADLIRHGLRARLGRPASRTVTVWAVLATIISGLFAAAFATRVGWETAEPLPRAAQTRTLLAEILPEQDFRDIEDAPAMFMIYGHPLSWAFAEEMLFFDGGEYALAGVGGAVVGFPATPPQETLDRTRHRLGETGWRVYRPMVEDTYTTLLARRGNTTLTLEVYSDPTVYAGPSMLEPIFLTASFQRATPPAVYPFAILGGIAGAVVAFLLFGWASRRTDRPHPVRGLVTTLYGVAMFFWWTPTLMAVPQSVQHHLGEPHPSWHPMWEWLGQPALSLFFVAGGGCALLGLALAALPRPRTSALPRSAPS